MKIKCLIVDDEPLAVKLIENHIAKIDVLEVVDTANTAMKAFEILNTQQIDLLFLDIKMPNITGIDFLKSLKHPPKLFLLLHIGILLSRVMNWMWLIIYSNQSHLNVFLNR